MLQKNNLGSLELESRHLLDKKKDLFFRRLLLAIGGGTIALFILTFFTLLKGSFLSIQHSGFSFFVTKTWDPVFQEYGAVVFFVGTLSTSILALLFSLPFSLSISLVLGEYLRKGRISSFLRIIVDLLAGIPSVIYGFWGLFVLVPIIRKFEMIIGVIPYGVGIFTAAVILSVMIIPFAASLGCEIVSMVPDDLKEAAYSLGATPFEVARYVILPYARPGIMAGLLMSFGRALSETMAVTMVIGNANKLPTSLFSPSNTLASVIANEFAEAAESLYLSSLVQLGLVLFLVTALINYFGRKVVYYFGDFNK